MSTVAEMKVTAIAPWFGSKRNLAPQIVALSGKHSAWWEPFCGSMAVLLAKPACPMETVNDLHGDLVNLARTIQHPTEGPRLYRRLRRAWMSWDAFQDSAEVIRSAVFEASPDRAYHYFLVSWIGRNGVAGTSNYNAGFSLRFTKNGGHSGKRFCSAVDSIPAWRERMRSVTILSHDGFELLERIEDAPGHVIYCDPPYLVKGAKYLHDFDASDHDRLAGLLRRFKKTRVLVSYYEHARLAELYPGWQRQSFDVSKAMASQGKREANDVRATEVVLINQGGKETQHGGLFDGG